MTDKKISALTSASTPLAGTETLPIVQSGVTTKVSVANLTAGRDVSASGATFTKAGVTQVTIENTTGTTKNTQLIFADNAGSKWRIGMDVFTNDNTNELQVYSDTAGASPLRIDTSSNIKIPVGNIIPGTAAKGINFTANTPAAGMTSQLLNWYEEGTWTPTLLFGGASTGIAYNLRVGRYTRTGNIVNYTLVVFLTSKGSATGAATITGLPFTKATDSIASAGSFYGDRISNLTVRIGSATSTISLAVVPSGPATSVASILDTDFSNTTYLSISGQYNI